MRHEQKWPQVLWLVRHGQSAGNVQRDAAEAASLPLIDIATRDVDTPLSDLGRQQAVALGHWFGPMPATEKPTVVLCSPYIRAVDTARLMIDAADLSGSDLVFQSDERLREKEFGIWTALQKSVSNRSIRSSARSALTWANSIFVRPAERAGPTSSC